ncbi:MAG TPA: asparagine synthase (glutamine-hydrolyzing) [Vicinamibacterales bacterium]|jgi:asparagine synthase (glutamine-hydrolysing)
MCGIAGRVNFRSERPPDAHTVRRMCDLIAHRGPDGSGVVVDGFAALGHRRLAVIDLTEAGAQPMASDDGRLWVTFNGEIYNFLELRARLEALGHRFRSESDTEVILAAYRQFGVECVKHLSGMFAFALWDAGRRRLFAARDRAGKKPFYYREDADGLAFASEPKAFLAEPSFVPSPDPTALSHYLTYQYVPTPMSAFAGVQRLPPAHYLVAEQGRTSVHRYWTLSYKTTPRSEGEAVEELRGLFRSAVQARLISDVPLGAFLSGGIDSGSVVALMAELGSGPVKTFSIGFEEKRFDELEYARLVATRYATDHHEFVVRPDAVSILPKLVWHYNEPFADSSAIPTFILSELTRRHVTVALNGDAGDENFAGYDRYRAAVLAGRFDRLPGAAKRAAQRLASLAPGAPSRSLLGRARRFFGAIGDDPRRRYVRWMSHFDDRLKRELCRPEFAAAGIDSGEILLQQYQASDAPDFVDATLDVDVHNYLPDDLLVKVDIATMAFGLEGRSPLLDHHLMEFAASLPASLKLRGNSQKYIFKQAVGPLLPRAILERPKMGFGVPLEAWFRGDLKDLAYDVLLSRQLRERGYFQETVIRRLLDEHTRGERAWHYQLWNLLVLELWHRTFIDRQPAVCAATLSDLGALAVA